jgi:hypothetical protein
MADASEKKTADPTKDPAFQRVVQHFLKTPHKPHIVKKKDGRRVVRHSKTKQEE